MGINWDLLRMIRLPIFVGGALGCCLGALLGIAAGGVFDPLRFLVCYLAVGFGDLSTHYSNNYYDAELDRLAAPKTFGMVNLLVRKAELLPLTLKFAKALSIISLTMSLVAVVLG